MKRLTKVECEYAATKLANKVFDNKIEDAKKEERVFGDYMIHQLIPKKVLELREEFAEFFTSSQQKVILRADTERYYGYEVFLSSNILNPVGTDKRFVVSEEIYKKASKLKDAVRQLDRKKESYRLDVTNALYQLRTKKRIEEQFPEALPYLSFDEKTNLPAPQYTELRNMLNEVV